MPKKKWVKPDLKRLEAGKAEKPNAGNDSGGGSKS